MIARIGRKGLSLVELLVAVLVLSVGILGMAAGTGWVLRMVELARLDTRRAIALQTAVEQVKSVPLANLSSGSITDGPFTIEWSIVEGNTTYASLVFTLTGPGRSGSTAIGSSISPTAQDFLAYTRVR